MNSIINKHQNALSSIRIVLCQTSHPGNIGSTARAMKTMGIERLYLVRPKHFPAPEADALASGAGDVLERAVVCHTLQEALIGTQIAAGLTARKRELSLPFSTPRLFAEEMQAFSTLPEIALVFGTEMSGLSAEELALCNHALTIPANPAYSSLNLSQAVQILCYELRQTLVESETFDVNKMNDAFPFAEHQDIEALYAHLEKSLTDWGFLNPKRPRRLMARIRRLLGRTQLEREEVSLLRGIIRAASDIEKKHQHG